MPHVSVGPEEKESRCENSTGDWALDILSAVRDIMAVRWSFDGYKGCDVEGDHRSST